MDIRVLGPLSVRFAGRELRLGGVKQRALFAMLALRMNDSISVAALIDGLWDGEPPAHPRRTIQVYVSRLRNVLNAVPDEQPGLEVVHCADGYSLAGEPETCDLNRFQRLAAKGYAQWPADPGGARFALHQALAQWQGEPLREFSREPFAENEGVRLSFLHSSALDLRVESDLACGYHFQLVPELAELTRRYPMNERLHAQLMIALYRSLRPAEALDVFRRLRRSLVRELAIEPSEFMQGLERAVLARSPDLDLVAPSGWTTTAATHTTDQSAEKRSGANGPVDNLPPRLRYFVGREAILAGLTASTRPDREGRAVHVLHGIGGVGKTQIALEFAHRIAERVPLRWWINSEEPGLIPQQVAELGRAIGLRFPNPSNPSATVLAWLAERADWLLVFDNATEPAAIERFLPAGPGTVLVTSRRRGWGELGSSTRVDVMTRVETVALLTARMVNLDQSVADRIADEIGDLPLAAAQVASYLDQTDIDPSRYLEMFRTHRSTLLGRGDVLGYPSRIDTTWTLSLDRLRVESPAGLALMEIASMLAPDEIPLRLIQLSPSKSGIPFLGDPDIVEDALATVVMYSLAQRRPAGFRVHRLLQEVIRQHLEPARRQQLSRALPEMLIAGRPGPPEQADQWSAYRTITPHVLAARELLGTSSLGRRLILDTVSYLSATGDARANRALLSAVLERWATEMGADHVDVLQLTAELLYLTTWSGRASAAADLGAGLLRNAMRVLGPAHPVALAAAAHHSLALAWDGQADLALAIGRSTADRASAVLGPNHPTTLLALANTTSAHGWRGDHLEACRVGAQAYERSNQVLGPNHTVTLHAAAMLSYAELWVGDIEHAHRLAQKSFDRAARAHADDHPTALWLASTLAFALIRLGGTDEAELLARQAHRRAAAALGADHTVTLVAGSVDGLAALRGGKFDHMRAVAQPTWEGLARVHGVDHPVTLGVATTLCLGAAATADRGLCRLTFAWETSMQSDRIFGPHHPNSVNARRSAEVLEALQAN
jgi:DNA-binding SARP family transcriptional activator